MSRIKFIRLAAKIAVCSVVVGTMPGCQTTKRAGKTVARGTKRAGKATVRTVKKGGRAVKNAVD